MQKRDAILITALARGLTYPAAAAEAGISVRTICSRMADPDFREQVRAARVKLLDDATGKLADAAGDAVDVLRELATSAESENVRVAAARALVALVLPLSERADFEERLARLELRVLSGIEQPAESPGKTRAAG